MHTHHGLHNLPQPDEYRDYHLNGCRSLHRGSHYNDMANISSQVASAEYISILLLVKFDHVCGICDEKLSASLRLDIVLYYS